MSCPLCAPDASDALWSDADWRVVRVDDADFPAFYRVVARAHVREFTDLDDAARQRCMRLVSAVERALRDVLRPDKVNLASLGNVVPHLHWHVIARHAWDSRFPQPVWQAPLREVDPPPRQRLPVDLPALDDAVRRALAAVG